MTVQGQVWECRSHTLASLPTGDRRGGTPPAAACQAPSDSTAESGGDTGWPGLGLTLCSSHAVGVFAGRGWSEWRGPLGPGGKAQCRGELAQPVPLFAVQTWADSAGPPFPSFVKYVRGLAGVSHLRCLGAHSLGMH